jgi:hypothetical protein
MASAKTGVTGESAGVAATSVASAVLRPEGYRKEKD